MNTALRWQMQRHSPFIAPRHYLKDRSGLVIASIIELPSAAVLCYPGSSKAGSSHTTVDEAKAACDPNLNPNPQPQWEPANVQPVQTGSAAMASDDSSDSQLPTPQRPAPQAQATT